MRRHHRELGGDPSAERRADEMHALETERVEQIEVVEREIGDVLDPFGRRRTPVPGMARREHGVSLRQPLLEFQPPPAAARAVQEQQRRSRPVAEHVDGRAADRQLAPRRRHQPMKRPPFGDSHWPVVNDDSSEARNRAVAAISRGSPTRPIGVRLRIALRDSSEIGAVIGVSM